MSDKPRYVFDTNVMVSAVIVRNSTPFAALMIALERGQLLLSNETAKEVREVLDRPAFDRYVTREERDRFIADLIHDAVLIEINQTIRACRDPSDDKFLELAVSADAGGIVTGDPDLLVLHPFRGIDILTPAQFMARETQA